MKWAALISPLALAACEAPAPTAESLIPEYRGTQAVALAEDLVQIEAEMTNALSPRDVQDYTDCAVAAYALSNGFGFARHVRANVAEDKAVWTGDAVYLLSRTLPRGLKTLDAEVVAEKCREKGIPVV